MKKTHLILLFSLFWTLNNIIAQTTKEYDMLLATIANPKAKIGDFISNGYTVDNTQLLSKNEYKTKRVIIAKFTLSNGSFDEVSFSKTYEEAVTNYKQLANPDLDIKYSPFDTSRPRNSKVWDSSVKYYENKK
jgi:hypothetical protein